MTTRKVAGYGWRADSPDLRDLLYHETPHGKFALPKPLPAKVDLRQHCPPVYDQGQLGSCTGNAIAAALEFDEAKQAEGQHTPSRLFIYYEERRIEGSIDYDSGAEIRDGMKVVAQMGAPPETDWPYDISRFTEKPPTSAYLDAAKHKSIRYLRVYPNGGLRACLAAGYPFVFGFTVYESFESEEVATTGIANLPAPGESVLGGHAVLCVGYDNHAQRFLVRNSWGTGWGQHGYFTLPFGYLGNPQLASDMWTVRRVT